MSEENTPSSKERPIPAAWSDNPFEAPTAHVEDARPAGDGTLNEEPNSLGAGRGSGWWSGGWSLFREAMGLWIGISITYLVLIVVLSMIPILGQMITYFLAPILMGGLMLGCRDLESGNGLSFGHLIAGFQKNFSQLVLVGVLYLVGVVLIGIIIVVAVFGGSLSAATVSGSDPAAAASAVRSLLLAILLGMALIVPLLMATWYAPALTIINDVPAIQAMKLSFKGCLRNIVPFLIYGLVGVVLAIIASIPLALGWLLLFPTMICSTYVSYREIFVD